MGKHHFLDQISLFHAALSDHPFRTREEENVVCVRAAAGDRRAIDEICKRNTRLAVLIARRCMGGLPDAAFADLFQEGMLGIVRALQDFKPGRGFRFSTYATWWVKAYASRHAHLLRSMVSRIDKTADFYLDSPLVADDADGATHTDVLESTLPPADDVVARARFDERVRQRLRRIEKRLAVISKHAPGAAMDVIEERLMQSP